MQSQSVGLPGVKLESVLQHGRLTSAEGCRRLFESLSALPVAQQLSTLTRLEAALSVSPHNRNVCADGAGLVNVALAQLPQFEDPECRAAALRIVRQLGRHRFTVHNTRTFLAAIQHDEAVLRGGSGEKAARAGAEALELLQLLVDIISGSPDPAEPSAFWDMAVGVMGATGFDLPAERIVSLAARGGFTVSAWLRLEQLPANPTVVFALVDATGVGLQLQLHRAVSSNCSRARVAHWLCVECGARCVVYSARCMRATTTRHPPHRPPQGNAVARAELVITEPRQGSTAARMLGMRLMSGGGAGSGRGTGADASTNTSEFGDSAVVRIHQWHLISLSCRRSSLFSLGSSMLSGQAISCNGYIWRRFPWLRSVTCGYMRLHAVTFGYVRLRSVTFGSSVSSGRRARPQAVIAGHTRLNFRLHSVTIGYIRLRHGCLARAAVLTLAPPRPQGIARDEALLCIDGGRAAKALNFRYPTFSTEHAASGHASLGAPATKSSAAAALRGQLGPFVILDLALQVQRASARRASR